MMTVRQSIARAGKTQHSPMSKRGEAVAKALGKRIRHLRKAKGWSQEYLAEVAGMHRTYMWGIEQGVRNPSVRQLTELAAALGVPIAALFTFD